MSKNNNMVILQSCLECLMDINVRNIDNMYLIIKNNINDNMVIVEYQEEKDNYLTTVVRRDRKTSTIINYSKAKYIYNNIGKLLNIDSIYFKTMYRSNVANHEG